MTPDRFEKYPFDKPDKQTRPSKSCQTCLERSKCEQKGKENARYEGCITIRNYLDQDKKENDREKRNTTLFGPVLENVYTFAPLSVQEIFSAFNFGPHESQLLAPQENEVLNRLYWLKRSYKEAARDLSIPSKRVKALRRSAKKKDPQNPLLWHPIHEKRIPPYHPFLTGPSLWRHTCRLFEVGPKLYPLYRLSPEQKQKIQSKCDTQWGTEYIHDYNNKENRELFSLSVLLRRMDGFWKAGSARVPTWVRRESQEAVRKQSIDEGKYYLLDYLPMLVPKTDEEDQALDVSELGGKIERLIKREKDDRDWTEDELRNLAEDVPADHFNEKTGQTKDLTRIFKLYTPKKARNYYELWAGCRSYRGLGTITLPRPHWAPSLPFVHCIPFTLFGSECSTSGYSFRRWMMPSTLAPSMIRIT